eukprot:645067-Lingulodinium_polyedra.AAC.1
MMWRLKPGRVGRGGRAPRPAPSCRLQFIRGRGGCPPRSFGGHWGVGRLRGVAAPGRPSAASP